MGRGGGDPAAGVHCLSCCDGQWQAELRPREALLEPALLPLPFLRSAELSPVPMVTASLPAALAWLLGGLFGLETLWSGAEQLEVRDLGGQAGSS